jgi:hypothetical protein
MDEARALLDQLMGKDRNLPAEQRRARHFTDEDVCKYYLCGGMTVCRVFRYACACIYVCMCVHARGCTCGCVQVCMSVYM